MIQVAGAPFLIRHILTTLGATEEFEVVLSYSRTAVIGDILYIGVDVEVGMSEAHKGHGSEDGKFLYCAVPAVGLGVTAVGTAWA
ncbi:hypothetical protein SCUP234_10373 [Seiridium cupressi]